MVIENVSVVRKSVGFDDTIDFGINVKKLSKIFKLLSTSTYKSIPESVVREITSNMQDAHTEAGNFVDPVRIVYDNVSDTISFIDKGVGMSYEFMTTQYIQLGESTKENSPELIGHFGIGRMSVFAYTDCYTVETIQANQKYHYIISKNSDDLPQIDFTHQLYTSEPNGTTVSFSLKFPSDFKKFKTAIENQLKYFKSVITEGFGINNEYKIYQGKHFSYRPDRTNVGGLEINFGGIYYPIDWDALEVERINLNCALYFPIETPFSPTASRESLENSDKTLKLIKDKIQDCIAELTDLWRKDQVVENFFTWLNRDGKFVDFSEKVSLNVTNFIKEDYLYKPIIGTKIDHKKLKDNYYTFLTTAFETHARKYSFNGSINSNTYYTFQDEISNYRLSRVGGWNCIRKKNYVDGRLLHAQAINYYKKEDVNYFTPNGKPDEYNGVVGPLPDLRPDFQKVIDSVWIDIIRVGINLDICQMPRRQAVKIKRLKDLEVRGQFYYESKATVKTLEEIAKKHIIVYTDDDVTFRIIRDVQINSKAYMPIFTAVKYHEKLREIGAITYEEFLKLKGVKKLFYKQIENSYRAGASFNDLNALSRVSKYQRQKYQYLYNYFAVANVLILPSKIMSTLRSVYDISHIMRHHERYITKREELRLLIDGENNPDLIKYKLLYNFYKKKCNARKN